MNVYVFHAALFCQHCGADHREGLAIPPGADLDDESTFDSDAYPKGPYGDGGGEADCPQHCDDCDVFLDNPLTEDGSNYVKAAFKEYKATGRGAVGVLRVWAEAYSEEYGEACWEESPGFPHDRDYDAADLIPMERT